MLDVILTKKQKRAFNSIKTGIDLSRKLNQIVRFLTLTTSNIQVLNADYSELKLNDNFRKFKQIIRRTKLIYLKKQGYIRNSDLRRYYQNKPMDYILQFDYFKVKTNEANGVLHILYKGDYIPYNYIVDIWNDLHNSWEINIQAIKTNKKNALKTAGYVITQYLSNQKTAYQRSSKSWMWTIRDYYKQFKLFLEECREKYFYNPVKQKFYKRTRQYSKIRKTFSDFPQQTLNGSNITKGKEIDFWAIWLAQLQCIILKRQPTQLPKDTQKRLSGVF